MSVMVVVVVVGGGGVVGGCGDVGVGDYSCGCVFVMLSTGRYR